MADREVNLMDVLRQLHRTPKNDNEAQAPMGSLRVILQPTDEPETERRIYAVPHRIRTNRGMLP